MSSMYRAVLLTTGLLGGLIAHAGNAQGFGAMASEDRGTVDHAVSPQIAPHGAEAWVAEAPMPAAVFRYGFAQHGNHFYVISGVKDNMDVTRAVQRYDVATGSWSLLAEIPTALESPTAAVWNDKIYVAGGAVSGVSRHLQIYDIATGTWTTGEPMPMGRWGAAAGAWNGKVYVAGGGDETGMNMTSLLVYDIATNTWSTGEEMPSPYRIGGYTQAGQYLYVVGGFATFPNNSTATLRLDMASGSWETGPAFTPARADFALAFDGSKLYAIGGDVNGGSWYEASDLIDELDVSDWPSGSWIASPEKLPVARQGNHAGFYANRRIWTTGGFANWVFNGELVSRKAGPEWTPVAPLATPRSRLALVHFPINGKFYAIGGEGPESNRNLPIEEYDPASDTWTDRTMLAVGVSNVGAVVVGDRIHIPGGWDGLVARKEHQIFDPLTNTVVLGEPMPMESFAHAVTARGKFIHVLGGFDHGEYPTTAHYIFDTDGNTWTNGAVLPEPVNYPAASSDGRYVYLFGGGTSDTHKAWRYDPILDSWTALPDLLTARGGPAAFPANGTFNVVGGGWNSYLDSMESFDGRVWVEGPTLVTGARTIGADAGGGIALKAGGYQEDYLASAEKLAVTGGGLGEYCNSVKTPIPDNGSTISTIVVPDARRIKNLSVKLSVKHGFVGDLAFTLSKGATSVTFFDRPGRTDSGFGCGGQNIAASFADDRGADGAWETSCMNTNPAFASGGRYTNNEPLSAFDGKSSAGTWMLTATDHADGNAGTLDEWCIKLAPTDVIFDDGFEG